MIGPYKEPRSNDRQRKVLKRLEKNSKEMHAAEVYKQYVDLQQEGKRRPGVLKKETKETL